VDATYILEGSVTVDGPWETVIADISIPYYKFTDITVPNATYPYYRVSEVATKISQKKARRKIQHKAVPMSERK
jgi:hypothetical protein